MAAAWKRGSFSISSKAPLASDLHEAHKDAVEFSYSATWNLHEVFTTQQIPISDEIYSPVRNLSDHLVDAGYGAVCRKLREAH